MPTVRWTPEQLDEYNKRTGAGESAAIPPPAPAPAPNKTTAILDGLAAPEVLAARPPRQNQLERDYDAILAGQQRAGEIRDYGFERLKLRMGYNTFYTPDFDVVRNDGQILLIDTKGKHVWDDALVKIKVAAAQFPQFTFMMARRINHDRREPFEHIPIPSVS